jgi:type I restriction enzyme S subunit
MVGEWTIVRLGDLTWWASGGTPSKANPEFWGGDIPWISASSMKTPLLCDSDNKITKEGLENGSRLAETNSILLLVRGSELHKRIPVGIVTRPVAFNQDVKALKVREQMCSDYLFYWLLGNEAMLLGKVEHTGIGAGKLDTEVLKNLPVKLPPLAEQKAIAEVLGALDDKIELNRRMNETLEGMARALFKSWFIDFDPVRQNLSRIQLRPTPQPSPKKRGSIRQVAPH